MCCQLRLGLSRIALVRPCRRLLVLAPVSIVQSLETPVVSASPEGGDRETCISQRFTRNDFSVSLPAPLNHSCQSRTESRTVQERLLCRRANAGKRYATGNGCGRE